MTKSLEQNRGLIKKAYLPPLVAPVSSVPPAVLEFLILLGLLLVASAVYFFKDGVLYLRVGPQTLPAVFAVALTIFFSIALGPWTSIMRVRHKDARYSLRYFLQFWFYVTPVIYPVSTIPEQYRSVIFLNPMAPLVETYK